MGIKEGDEVITTANSWISSSETISQVGAKPVFVDVHPDYYTLDESKLEAAITPIAKSKESPGKSGIKTKPVSAKITKNKIK